MLLPRYRSITITGTRAIKGTDKYITFDLFKETFGRLNTENTSWFVGGAMGIDTWALDWLALFGKGIITVVVPKDLSSQPAPAIASIKRAIEKPNFSLVELKQIIFPKPESYHYRNRFMVDRSNIVFAYPHKTQRSPGTRYTIDYALDTGKMVRAYPIGN